MYTVCRHTYIMQINQYNTQESIKEIREKALIIADKILRNGGTMAPDNIFAKSLEPKDIR